MEQRLKIIVEKHADGYVAYPLGMKGIVVGQGDTYEQALDDVRSAIRFHIETFGRGNYSAGMADVRQGGTIGLPAKTLVNASMTLPPFLRMVEM